MGDLAVVMDTGKGDLGREMEDVDGIRSKGKRGRGVGEGRGGRGRKGWVH